MMKDLEFLEHVIDQKSQMILDANDRIWEYAELAYHETRSADLLCQILKDEGFSVTTGDAGIPTCFTGTFSYGSGKPVMGILGEYDALSSLSQKAEMCIRDRLDVVLHMEHRDICLPGDHIRNGINIRHE